MIKGGNTMPIINQPFQGQLGNIIISELEKDYTEFTIFSAFAKNSGVLRLKDSIEKFKSNGGYAKAFVGIDLDGTSYVLLQKHMACSSTGFIRRKLTPKSKPQLPFLNKIY
jgi:hypothetical protein